MAELSLIRVGNRFIEPLDLTVPHGCLFILVGPSGAGKTSLLRILAGLAPHRGRILLDGQDIGRRPPHRREIGFLTQEPYLFPHLGLEANLDLGMTRLGWSKARKRRRREELVELVGVSHLAGRDAVSLSGGEKQRVALARVLASNPRLLLLDEPFSRLDFRSAGRLRLEFKRLQQKLALTTLMVTHNLDEACQLGDRTAVIQNGRLCPAEIAPSVDQTFLEVPNRLACRLVRVRDEGLLELTWQGLPLFALDRGKPENRFLVRPSCIRLGRTPPPGPKINRFEGRVAAVEANRDSTRLEVLVRDQNLRIEIHRPDWEAAPVEVGQTVHGFIPLESIQPD